jgi:hypothetical protein
MTLLALGYQANESNKFTLLKEKEATCDGEGLYNLPEGQSSHAKATITLSCSLADIKDVNSLMANFVLFTDPLVEHRTHVRDYTPIVAACFCYLFERPEAKEIIRWYHLHKLAHPQFHVYIFPVSKTYGCALHKLQQVLAI